MASVSIKSRNEAAVIRHAKALDAAVLQAMRTGLSRGLQLVAADSQRNFIQDGPRLKGEFGPGARLHSISGQLRRSINTTTEQQPGRVIGRIGSALKYAAYHEFGFHGVMNVRAHVRVTGQFEEDEFGGDLEIDTRRQWRDLSGNFLGFRDSRKAAARRQRAGYVTVQFVRAHSRRVDYAGKPYIRPALNRTDLLGEIKEELKKL